MKNQALALLILALLSVSAFAQNYPPKFPSRASYTFTASASPDGSYIKGKHYHDYDRGLVRWDEISVDSQGVETLNEISIWDLRAATVTYIAIDNLCMVAKTEPGATPSPVSFDSWSFQSYQFQKDYMAEIWNDGQGSQLYVDAFTRLPTAITNMTQTREGDITTFEWDLNFNSDVFILPSLLKCAPTNSTVTQSPGGPFVRKGIACGVCKTAVGFLTGKGCGAAARVACLATGPIAPFCGIILPIICRIGCTAAKCADAACRAIHAC